MSPFEESGRNAGAAGLGARRPHARLALNTVEAVKGVAERAFGECEDPVGLY